MPDREFDSSVQRKANELRLEPSPEVWERVAAQINEKDRRRVAPWLWLAAAMIAGALSFWFLSPVDEGIGTSKKTTQLAEGKVSEEPSKPASKLSNPATDPSNSANTPAGSANDPSSASAAASNSTGAYGESGTGTTLNGKASRKLFAPDRTIIATNDRGNQNTGIGRPKSEKNKHITAKTADDYTSTFSENRKERLENTSNVTRFSSEEDLLKNSVVQLRLNKPSQPTINANLPDEGDAKLNASLLENMPSEAPQQNTKNWGLAMQVGGGSGSMREGLANSYSPERASMDLANNAFLAPAAARPPQEVRPSDVRPGPSFQIGVGISKPISNRLSVVSGLQYAYFSNRIEVGRKIDSVTMNANFRLQALQSTPTTAAYNAAGNNGTTYVNAYHYLQVPLELSWAVDPAKRFTWNNGFLIGYLISTDALHYNATAGAYYQDNSLVNKWQTSVQTSFQYRLFKSSSWNINLGPYVNYQLRNVDKTADHKRLFTVGMNARLVFGQPK